MKSIEITFRTDALYSSTGKENWSDLRFISLDELSWYYFLGRFSIVVHGVEVGPDWGWNPLLHLVRGMSTVLAAVETNGEARFGFTENDERLIFRQTGSDLTISSTFSPRTVVCALAEFVQAYELFARNAMSRVLEGYPSLQENPEVLVLARRHGITLPPRRLEAGWDDVPVPRVDEVVARIDRIVTAVADEIGDRPALGEFLEIVGRAVPDFGAHLDEAIELPLTFTAILRGGLPYESDQASRAGRLSAAVLDEASGLMAFIGQSAYSATGTAVPPPAFAAHLMAALAASDIAFADVRGGEVLRLNVAFGLRGRMRKVGDVLAIPSEFGGYHMAVIVARNRFGMALGLFRGTVSTPEVERIDRGAVWRHPVYVDPEEVATWFWKYAGHERSLLDLFPSDPEIFHSASMSVSPSSATGFGVAEAVDGSLRTIGEEEARKAGLVDGSYLQKYLAVELEALLEEAVE
ncbi:hypothetical protein [Spongiactinospora sp. 9N601]|uniref:hypothetical protein n=1 Tax=Spongiactinospora sp. 9N601 TaxID=3375149 RepID=UPI00379EF035